ncbi:uncharacterized protein C8Q71DRAFT_859900 [Rhodofomes roseus]|uniref:DUF6532 domain-containing protein n=1 Tax=Rhodofomes roseus TaxID=34475 RepID=A0ABQ8KA50_9APHY|nr:uncharacterized protein C8Q71DRAFT_859900 [Rhodofomes roseus]KAH9834243.1 hypothetical protein C8Q71DRAFT_859900 [Rhodofomes roseus]
MPPRAKRQTRAAATNPGTAARPQAKPPKASKQLSPPSQDESEDGDVSTTMTAVEKKLYQKLKAKQELEDKKRELARKANIRKRSNAMTMEETQEDKGEDEDEGHYRLRKKTRTERDVESVEDEGSQDKVEEDEEVEEPKERQRPKPKPIFKGKGKAVQPIEEQGDNDDVVMQVNEDDGLDEEERELARQIAPVTKKTPVSPKKTPVVPKKTPVSPKKTPVSPVSPKKDTRAAAPAAPASPSEGKAKGRPRRLSKGQREVFDYVEITVAPTKSKKNVNGAKVADKAASAKAGKSTWYSLRSILRSAEAEDSGDDEERGTVDEGDELDEEESGGEDEASNHSDVKYLKGKRIAKGRGKRRQGSSGVARKRLRNRALVTDLPDIVAPVRNLAASYLKMHIALEQAWTTYNGSTNGRLSDRHEVLETVMTLVATHKNKDGRVPRDLGVALDELLGEGEEVDALRKMVLDLVWQGASQMRNDLKKKAKQVVNEAYGFAGLKAPKKEALATWLLKTYKQSMKGGYASKSKGGSRVDEQKSKLANTKLFQHPAIAKLIYAFWFSLSHKEVRDQRKKFSSVPDNLIALVCNVLEAAIKDHLQTSASNALDLQFSNKIYAPKGLLRWNDHMTILEEMRKVRPEVYQRMKSGIWTRVNLKIKEDDKVRGRADEESLPSQPQGFNWDDISADDIEEMEREGEEDKVESEDEANTKDGEGTSLRELSEQPAESKTSAAATEEAARDSQDGAEGAGGSAGQDEAGTSRITTATKPRSSTAHAAEDRARSSANAHAHAQDITGVRIEVLETRTLPPLDENALHE